MLMSKRFIGSCTESTLNQRLSYHKKLKLEWRGSLHLNMFIGGLILNLFSSRRNEVLLQIMCEY